VDHLMIENSADLRGYTMAMNVPVGPQMTKKTPLFRKR